MTRRYSLVKVISQRPVSGEQFEAALVSSVRRLFGEFGLARINPRIIKFATADSAAVIACNKEGAEDLQTAIGLISDTDDTKIVGITMRISGTIKGLRGKQRF
jgi:RNase P/RNase MRP subunit POP5